MAFAQAGAPLSWTCASVQLGNFAVLKTRLLSKWITAERVAKAGSAGSSATFMSTVRAPTDFGLAAVPALLWASLTATDLMAVDRLGERRRCARDEDQRAGEGQRQVLTQ